MYLILKMDCNGLFLILVLMVNPYACMYVHMYLGAHVCAKGRVCVCGCVPEDDIRCSLQSLYTLYTEARSLSHKNPEIADLAYLAS